MTYLYKLIGGDTPKSERRLRQGATSPHRGALSTTSTKKITIRGKTNPRILLFWSHISRLKYFITNPNHPLPEGINSTTKEVLDLLRPKSGRPLVVNIIITPDKTN